MERQMDASGGNIMRAPERLKGFGTKVSRTNVADLQEREHGTGGHWNINLTQMKPVSRVPGVIVWLIHLRVGQAGLSRLKLRLFPQNTRIWLILCGHVGVPVRAV